LATLRSSNRTCFSCSLVARGRTRRFVGREITEGVTRVETSGSGGTDTAEEDVENEVPEVVAVVVEGVGDVDIRREGGLIVRGMSDVAVSAEAGE